VLPDTWRALVDLVLPAGCAGCGEPAAGGGLCGACDEAFAAARPGRVVPTPVPAGFPMTMALAGYGGALREAVLEYKERGRYRLAGALGDRLADVISAAQPGIAPVLLVPVPATARAARVRHGDHMARLARRAAHTLRISGRPAAVAYPVRARPRPDSTDLSAVARAVAAQEAFVARQRRTPAVRAAVAAGASVVLVDDVVTTGATLAAVANRLRMVGVEVQGAAVLAATARHAAAHSVTGAAPRDHTAPPTAIS
jgi:predicted amidophosphoribosyltransferase